MHKLTYAIVAGAALFFLAGPAHAKCDPDGADAADVAAARAAIAASCDCAGAPNHGTYVKCAVATAKAELVNQSCKGAVVRCAARSTCGKPNFVTCCRTNSKGKTNCSTRRSVSSCKAPRGGSACVGVHASCCDSCTTSGCASPSGAFIDGAGSSLY
jgi:hypothetical protein